MDYHQNARLTIHSREQLARKVLLQRCTLKLAAASFNVSAKTAAKWVRRYGVQGAAGLRDLSSRPHYSPRQTSSALSEKVLDLRRQGMSRFSEVSLRGDGRLRGKRKHPGFLALHVAVDDHSRLAFTQILADQKAQTTIAFLHHAREFFARHGIGVRALLTDNGSSYRSQLFRQACQRFAIQHHRTRPYSPQTNGKAERFIQTALREWAYAKHWSDSDQRDACLQPWTDYYNHQRPHGSLSYKPPISRSDIGTTS